MNRNPLRYRGYYYDVETGFYYLQSRYYDPANHRFINADCYTDTGTGFLGYNMFAYCLNNPVRRKDISGTTSADIFDGDGNPATDDDMRFDGGSVPDRGLGVNSSYYTSQKVQSYDWRWQNSSYNQTPGYPSTTAGQQHATVDAFDAFVDDPTSIVGKTEAEIGELLGEGWRHGTYGSNGTGWKYLNGDKMVAYHPGGGRHVGSYYKFSSAKLGKLKVVGPDYVEIPGDSARIIRWK